LSFETIANALGRDEVAVAALFYGQAKASPEDIKKLAEILNIPEQTLLSTEMSGWPDRGHQMEMPPKEPLIYRLYEIVQNYGYAYKAVMNEKFGDGIMSAISFSTKVEKEVDEKGEWCKITLRGKWYDCRVRLLFALPSYLHETLIGCHIRASKPGNCEFLGKGCTSAQMRYGIRTDGIDNAPRIHHFHPLLRPLVTQLS